MPQIVVFVVMAFLSLILCASSILDGDFEVAVPCSLFMFIMSIGLCFLLESQARDPLKDHLIRFLDCAALKKRYRQQTR
jgi:hypothetical protein